MSEEIEEGEIQIDGTVHCGCGCVSFEIGIQICDGHDHVVALKCARCSDVIVGEGFICLGETNAPTIN